MKILRRHGKGFCREDVKIPAPIEVFLDFPHLMTYNFFWTAAGRLRKGIDALKIGAATQEKEGRSHEES